MEPQKSIILPILLSILGSSLLFGGGGYYLATVTNITAPPATQTQTTVRATNKPNAIPSSSMAQTSATTNDTANWEIYTNSNFKFSLKHPTDWKLVDTIQSAGQSAGANQSLSLTGTSSNDSLSLTLWINPEGHGIASPEATYSIEYKNNQIIFGEKKISEQGPDDDIKILKGGVHFIGTLNGAKYLFTAKTDGSKVQENLIKDIISSYKALN